MMILRGGGVTLFPYHDLGGLWKISNENYRGGNHFLDLLVSKYKRLKIV